jgi:hypothetical protein
MRRLYKNRKINKQVICRDANKFIREKKIQFNHRLNEFGQDNC